MGKRSPYLGLIGKESIGEPERFQGIRRLILTNVEQMPQVVSVPGAMRDHPQRRPIGFLGKAKIPEEHVGQSKRRVGSVVFLDGKNIRGETRGAEGVLLHHELSKLTFCVHRVGAPGLRGSLKSLKHGDDLA
jgi:hypothetical protein